MRSPLPRSSSWAKTTSSARPRGRRSFRRASRTRRWWSSRTAATYLISRNRRPFSKRSEDGYIAAEERYSPDCVEGASALKKWLSSLSAAQESPKTRPKHYENVVLGPRTGDTRERERERESAREGGFQQAGRLREVRLSLGPIRI